MRLTAIDAQSRCDAHESIAVMGMPSPLEKSRTGRFGRPERVRRGLQTPARRYPRRAASGHGRQYCGKGRACDLRHATRESFATHGLEPMVDRFRAHRQRPAPNAGIQREMPMALHRDDQRRLRRREPIAADPIHDFSPNEARRRGRARAFANSQAWPHFDSGHQQSVENPLMVRQACPEQSRRAHHERIFVAAQSTRYRSS